MNRNQLICLSLIIGFAFLIRLIFALYSSPDLFDLHSFELFASIIRRGGNIYSETTPANYSPLWFYYLYVFDWFSGLIHVPIPYIIRCFMAIVDSINALLIFIIVRRNSPGKEWLALCVYAFNPAVILITSYHSNIDAFALLPLLYVLSLPTSHSRWAWILGTFSILIKQITAFLVFTVFVYKARSIRQLIFWLGSTCVVFIASFIPYYSASKNIIRYVFGHSGDSGVFGLTIIFPVPIVFGLFFLIMTILPIISRFWLHIDLPSAMLASSLAFIMFTPGFFGQYQLAALTFGALYPSICYLIFSATGLIYLVNYYGFFNTYSLRHLLWLAAILYMINILFHTTNKKSTKRLLTAQSPE